MMEVSVAEAIGRMLRAAVQEPDSTLYVHVGEKTEVILRTEESERRILQGPPKAFDQLRTRLLGMADMNSRDSAITREGQILYLVDGQMHHFALRLTRSLLDSNAYLVTLRHMPRA